MNGRPWTTEEDAWLVALYPDVPTAEVARCVGHSLSSTYQRARKLGDTTRQHEQDEGWTKKGQQQEPVPSRDALACSFCRGADDRRFVSGPAGVLICDRCVRLCVEIFMEDARTRVEVDAVESGRRGGLARAAKLSPEQRSESARRAARARWDNASRVDPVLAVDPSWSTPEQAVAHDPR